MSSLEPWNAKIFKEFSKVTKLKKIDYDGDLEKTCKEKGFHFEIFAGDKLERFVFTYTDWPAMGATIHTGGAIPDETKYDFPMLVWDNLISKSYLMVLVDLQPLRPDDEDYRQKYIEPMASVHNKYKDLSGYRVKRMDWWDTFRSPYDYLAYTKVENEQKTVDITMDYFNLWLKFYKEAKPVEDPELLRKAAERKKYIKDLMVEKDPGKGPLVRLFGAETAHKLLELMF